MVFVLLVKIVTIAFLIAGVVRKKYVMTKSAFSVKLHVRTIIMQNAGNTMVAAVEIVGHTKSAPIISVFVRTIICAVLVVRSMRQSAITKISAVIPSVMRIMNAAQIVAMVFAEYAMNMKSAKKMHTGTVIIAYVRMGIVKTRLINVPHMWEESVLPAMIVAMEDVVKISPIPIALKYVHTSIAIQADVQMLARRERDLFVYFVQCPTICI